MPAFSLQIRIYCLFVLLWLFGNTEISAQTVRETEQKHEITIYVMPTLCPIKWESPADLYNSTMSCYLKTALVSNNYLLGHLAVQLNTPLLPKSILTAMKSTHMKERVDFMFIKKIGFSILGASFRGKLETEEELNQHFKAYSKRNKLAFITYRINEQAAKRIIQLIEKFSQSQNNKPAASNYYGGAFWPRYQSEGAGCSAFGMALLDVANLLDTNSQDWLVQVNIPMSIIGGEFNNDKKVKISTVRKTKSWHNGTGKINVDYIPYKVYEPSIMFEWIMKQRTVNNSRFKPLEKDGVPGLYIDCKDVLVSADEPIFIERTESNVFINKYLKKIQAIKHKTE